MAAHAPAQHEKGQLSNGMLGFIMFLASEVMFFGGLFAAYFIARADSAQWPPALSPEQEAADEADRVGPRLGQQPLDARVGGVDAQDEVAVLGVGPHQELRRVRTGDGGHERHGAECSAARAPAQG